MARVQVDGERILEMLLADVRAGALPVTDFPSSQAPLLESIFGRIVQEFAVRNERTSRSHTQAGGAAACKGRLPAMDYAALEADVRRRFPEYIPLKATGKRACLERYREVVGLGTGRFGVVYAAGIPEDARPGYRYALKAVAVHPFAQPLQYQNLLNEIDIGTRMGELGVGPKVHAVHWCREDGGLLVMIASDLMTRGDLQQFSRTRALTSAHLKKIRKKLRAMHAAGYLHNDLHSRNVLVTESPDGGFEFFIGDYGFACPVADMAVATPEAERLKRAEMRSLDRLETIVTRDMLRGMLYRMVAEGRILADIDFHQSPDPAGASSSMSIPLSGSESDDPARTEPPPAPTSSRPPSSRDPKPARAAKRSSGASTRVQRQVSGK